jgi:hypothetical protein
MYNKKTSELFFYTIDSGEMDKKLLEKTGSVIYVQEENWETSITIFFNVLNLLMKENFILILSI